MLAELVRRPSFWMSYPSLVHELESSPCWTWTPCIVFIQFPCRWLISSESFSLNFHLAALRFELSFHTNIFKRVRTWTQNSSSSCCTSSLPCKFWSTLSNFGKFCSVAQINVQLTFFECGKTVKNITYNILMWLKMYKSKNLVGFYLRSWKHETVYWS